MTSHLEILKAGTMTSIQDLGRGGFAYFAIPKSGVMDSNSAKIALLLLNKKEDEPLIECTMVAPHIRFGASTQIALTGADFDWQIDNKKVPRNTVVSVPKGGVLKGKFVKNGLRGYIAIKGDLQVDSIYQSAATYINAGIGGHKGRLLKKGDVLKWDNPTFDGLDNRLIPIQKGPEFDYLTDSSKKALVENIYTISPDSNRMGARLKGQCLESITYQLKDSLPVLPGFVQLPPNGLPIVLLQDGQISGGYPRIAYIPERHLNLFNQIPLGGEFRFLW